MPSVFVSYSSKDAEFVERLTHDLELRQAHVWWDRRLSPGERFVDMILRQASDADFVVAVHSGHSRASKWVALEMGAVLAREARSEGILQLISIDQSDLPQWISNRNAVKMDGANYQDGLRSLCEAMEIRYEIDQKGYESGRQDSHLKVFQAGGQWMELLLGRHGLECILVDGSEKMAHVQWTMTRDKLLHTLADQEGIRVRAPRDEIRPWGTFDIGSRTSWRWSPHLFDINENEAAHAVFEQRLRTFLNS